MNVNFSNVVETKSRICMTCLRLSCHNLRIETGGFPNVPRIERKCLHCNCGDIEDVYHFIFKCSRLEHGRNPLLDHIHHIDRPNLSNIEKIRMVLVNPSQSIATHIASL